MCWSLRVSLGSSLKGRITGIKIGEGRQPLYVINGETFTFVTPYSANYDLREGDGAKQENEALEGGRVMCKEN